MNSEADFVAAIEANPDDELLLQAFSDWLEERGDPRAPWVRSAAVRPWMGPRFEDPLPKLAASLAAKKNVIGVRTAAAAIGAPLVPALVELLKNDDAEIRKQVILCLRRMRKAAAAAVPALLEALQDGDASVRDQAAKAVKEIGAKKGTSTANLLGALTDYHYNVRKHAAGILGSLGAKEAVLEQLSSQLDGPDADTRRSAVEALGNLRSKAVFPPLCRALSDADESVRAAAAEYLCRLVARGNGEVVGPLRAALKDRSAEVREKAAAALGNTCQAGAEGTADLILLLKDRSARVRAAAAQALGHVAGGDEKALAALERALDDPDVEAAVAAARALDGWTRLPERIGGSLLTLLDRIEAGHWRRGYVLGVMGRLERAGPEVLAALREAVRGDIWRYWHESGPYVALMRIGPAAAEAVPELAEAVRRGSDQAAQALAHLGEPGTARLVELLDSSAEQTQVCTLRGLFEAGSAALPALPRLRRFLRAKHDPYQAIWLMRGVCNTIQAIGPPAVDAFEDLLPQLNTNWEPEARAALASFGPALLPHLPRLLAILRDPAPYWTHVSVTKLLGRLGKHTPEVVEPLREALRGAALIADDPDYSRRGATAETRQAAAKALGAMGEAAAAAVPDLLPLLADPQVDVRRPAAEALGKLRSAAAAQGLSAALRDEDEKVRLLTVEALGQIGGPAAADALAPALKDGSTRVRREAAAALGRMKANTEAVLAALRRAEADRDKGVRTQAAAALRKIEGRRKR